VNLPNIEFRENILIFSRLSAFRHEGWSPDIQMKKQLI